MMYYMLLINKMRDIIQADYSTHPVDPPMALIT
jgi:hypothetical protein